ncbi:MAG: translation initiation factor IF-2 [Candidatus Omnitrophica bacterium]|nr:translation initiation factor IF-2 [Candidatus Omnitrophota bacterium]
MTVKKKAKAEKKGKEIKKTAANPVKKAGKIKAKLQLKAGPPKVEAKKITKPVVKPALVKIVKPQPKAGPPPAEVKKPVKAEPKPAAVETPKIQPKPQPKTAAPIQQPAPKVLTSAAKSPVAPKATVPAPAVPVTPAAPIIFKAVELDTPISVKDLASKLSLKPNDIIKVLMNRKIFATINQSLDEAVVHELAKGFGYEIKRPPTMEEELLKEHRQTADKGKLTARPPVVTFMGHVDHGKTSLLDYIRKTNVAAREHGGITQHIGAYSVTMGKGRVTFLDTPGHEAFTAMRARGANATDIVVLVIAADDGIMPQTIEAMDHAKAAGVTIVVALNKCDLPSANIDKVKKQLAQHGLHPEDWGGKTIVVPVSARTGQGVNELLEMLLLEAELLELKANPQLRARGVIIEGHLSPGKGPVATVLVKHGTLHDQDVILSGLYYGRVRAMFNDRGQRVKEAPPSTPAEISGLSGVPRAGDEFFVVKDERKARTLSLLKQDQKRAARFAGQKKITLEDLYKQAKEGKVRELKIILKADVQGSLEALGKSLESLSTPQIKLSIIHSGIGTINESDVILAAASNTVIIGFNVKAEDGANDTAQKESVEIKIYHIIYEAIADVRAAMEGMLEPIQKEVFMGRATVKQAFRVSKVGTIAGCYIQKGQITRQAKIKLIRDKRCKRSGRRI